MFKKEDIQTGYAVRMMCESAQPNNFIAEVLHYHGVLTIIYDNGFEVCPVSALNDNLEYKDMRVECIYGMRPFGTDPFMVFNRPLLWDRKLSAGND